MDLRPIKLHLTFRTAKVKCFAMIVLVTLVVIVSHKIFNPTNPTSAKMCNPNSYAIQIIDESVAKEVPSIKAVNDPYFRSFITSVTDRVLSKFVEAKSCQDNSDGEPTISLVFVRLPLVTSGDEPIAPAPSLDVPQSEVTCRLDSPWAKLAIRRSDNPLVRAVFIWSERQFLLDQVLLSDENQSITTPLTPLTNSLFEQYAMDYADFEIPISQSASIIAERIPADVLWLFRHSWQSTRGPFSGIARGAMNKTLERAADSYINLAMALFDRCFASQNSQQRYESILDVSNLISLDEYQINQLN